MKKILALILALSMVLCVFAGCSNKENEKENNSTVNTEDVGDTTKPADDATTPGDDSTEPNDEPTQVEGRQELWEDVFTNGKYTMTSNSFVLDADGVMLTTVYTDADGEAYMAFSGSMEGNEVGVALYHKDEDTVYFHQFGKEGDVTVDEWYKCVMSEDTETEDTDSTIDSSDSTDSFISALGNIQSVEYVESVGDVDKVIVTYTEAQEEDDEWTTTYDATLELTYNETTAQYRYTESTSDFGTSSSAMAVGDDIEGFSWSDWEFDKETMTLTRGEETIKCTLVTDHITEEVEPSTMEVEINSKTYDITKMVMKDSAGAVSTIEFMNCDDVAAMVNVPDEVTEEMAYDDAAMQLAMMMLAFAFSGMEAG